MKKILMILLLFGSVFLVACDKKEKEKEKEKEPPVVETLTKEELATLIAETKEAYIESERADITYVITSADAKTTLNYSYQFNGFDIEGLSYELISADVFEINIYEGNQYINIDGNKYVSSISEDEKRNVIRNYHFLSASKTFYELMDQTLLDALVLKEEKEGVYELNVDFSKYTPNSQIHEMVNETTSSLTVYITVKDDTIIQIEIDIVKKDNKEHNLVLKFNGLNESIVYPEDLNTYQRKGGN